MTATTAARATSVSATRLAPDVLLVTGNGPGEASEANATEDAGEVTPPAAGLYWQLVLQARRQELIGPLDHVLDLTSQLASGAADLGREDFAADLAKIRQATEAARGLIAEALIAGTPSDETAAAEARRRLRHDLRNRLNVILGLAALWREDAEELFLGDFVEDLELIARAGHTCEANIDAVLPEEPKEHPREGIPDPEQWPEPPRPTQRGRLLIVDDDPLNRDVLRRRLERVGHTVAEADAPAAALAALAVGEFDLVLLDIILHGPAGDSGRNGFDVLGRIKADDRLRDLPVILISALSDADLVARGIALGAEDYLSRPIDPTLLTARIESCLERVRLRRKEQGYLAEIEAQRRRADELLGVLLPEPVVEELKRTDQIPPRRYERVAVLFADICGFTPYCDHRPPEEVITRLATVVDLWEEAAAAHGVQKIKTIGDAFMAAAGLFDNRTDAVLACVRCGLAMIAGTQRLVPDWNLRVGIHFGEVVGGKVGRRQYLFDLWGDTVNTAARMESHGTPGAITLSRGAWDQIAGAASGEFLEIDVKGKGVQEVVRLSRLFPPPRPGV